MKAVNNRHTICCRFQINLYPIVRKEKRFGLQVGQAIQYEWFRKDGMNCRFYNQWADFNRLDYMRGESSQ